jgi:hypothetical protein
MLFAWKLRALTECRLMSLIVHNILLNVVYEYLTANCSEVLSEGYIHNLKIAVYFLAGEYEFRHRPEEWHFLGCYTMWLL